MTEAKPGKKGKTPFSGKKNFFKAGAGTLSSYERNSPIYSLLSGQRVGQIPIDEHKDIDREELTGYQKIVSGLEWTLLLSVLFCALLPWVSVPNPAVLTAAMAAFAAFVCAVHHWWRRHHGTRWHLALNTWAVIVFTTAAVWQTGALSSPLQPLYFVSIMLTGTTLDRRTVMAQTAFISVCYGLLAMADADGNALAGGGKQLFGPIMHAVLLWVLAGTVSLVSKETDITKEKIRQLSRTDQLTGLWNMKMLLIFMQREYQRTLTRAGKFSVLMIDADSLKAVNDAYGHHAGTMLIVSISETMRSELREEDMLARFGGDEFVAFLPETNCQDAYKVAERLRRRIAETPLHYEGNSVSITVSCGIACFPDHGEDLTEIMKMADRALYQSKDAGKNKCTIFRLPADGKGK